MEEALGIDISYIVDVQIVVLFGHYFFICITYCKFYGDIYIRSSYAI